MVSGQEPNPFIAQLEYSRHFPFLTKARGYIKKCIHVTKVSLISMASCLQLNLVRIHLDLDKTVNLEHHIGTTIQIAYVYSWNFISRPLGRTIETAKPAYRMRNA